MLVLLSIIVFNPENFLLTMHLSPFITIENVKNKKKLTIPVAVLIFFAALQ
jgi:hypothetical protein